MLLAAGVGALHFDVTPGRIALIGAAAIATQWLCTRVTGGPRVEWRSAAISALSLALLLRTTHAWVAAAAAVIAIGSKFTLRVRGKHVFNPTNLALAIVLATGTGWVSPGQWGATTTLAFAVVCAGGLVVTRAGRADVTLAFLGAFAALLFAGCAAVGQPPAVPLHRLASGALLLFAFFMITDPRTTPDARAPRIAFAFAVAALAWVIAFQLHRANALQWALVACSPLSPLADRLFPAPRYTWATSRPLVVPPADPAWPRASAPEPIRGDSDVPLHADPDVHPGARAARA